MANVEGKKDRRDGDSRNRRGRTMPTTVEEYFKGHAESKALFDAVRKVVERLAPTAEVRATRSQIAFRRKRGFAFVWIPANYLRAADLPPLVLSVGLRRRDPSPRWKEIVEPYPGRFTHHLELRSVDQIDAEVRAWLRESGESAG